MSPNRYIKGVLPVLGLLFLFLFLGFFGGIERMLGAEPAKDPNASPLRVGFTQSMFTDLNPNEAKAALKVWAESIADSKNLNIAAEALVYDDLPALQRAINQSAVELVALRIDEYLDLNLPQTPEVIFSGSSEGMPTDKPLLVTQHSISSLSRLQNKRVNILMDAYVGMSLAWLNGALLESGFPEIHQFSSDVKEIHKTSQTVLPVFFGQRDACLVPKRSYETMVELNPQIGKKLTVLLEGPDIVSGIMFLRPDYRPSFIKDLVEALEELHLNPKGQQVLMLFKINRIIHCQDRYIRQAKELIGKYRMLKNGAVKQALN